MTDITPVGETGAQLQPPVEQPPVEQPPAAQPPSSGAPAAGEPPAAGDGALPTRQPRAPREPRPPRDPAAQQQPRERQARQPRPPREPGAQQQPREARDARQPRDPREAAGIRKPREQREREASEDRETAVADRRTRRTWIPRVASWVIGLSGVLNIASAVAPKFYHRFSRIADTFPAEVTGAATGATVFMGVLLLLLTRGLRRRKRRAHKVAVAVLAVTAMLHVIREVAPGEAIFAIALLSALLIYRDQFYAASDPRTRWGGLAWFMIVAPSAILFGIGFLSWRSRWLVPPHPLTAEVEHVLLGLVGLDGPLNFVDPRRDNAFGTGLFVLGFLIGLSTIYLVLRPAEPLASLGADDENRLRELLDKHGGSDSLGYFALRRDKAVIWSPTAKSAITYRVVSGVMLASGDPLGDSEAWPGAIKAFIEEAERHAWVPAVIGCSERAAEVWLREADLDALEIGDEAVLEVANFSLDGRPMRNVRQMVNRVERADYTATVCKVADVPRERIAALSAQASAWASTETERGFSMALGRLGDPADGDCVIAVASLEDRARAILHFVPWGKDGLSLDLMRRDRTAMPGLNEFLIVETFKAAERLGFRRVSLNFAVFRSALARGERIGAGPILRAWRAVLVFLSRWFQIESLYKFNAKLLPEWQPRFVCFPTVRDIPRIAIAALEAEAFINWPKFSWRTLTPWRRAFQRGT